MKKLTTRSWENAAVTHFATVLFVPNSALVGHVFNSSRKSRCVPEKSAYAESSTTDGSTRAMWGGKQVLVGSSKIDEVKHRPSLIDSANLFSRFFFLWVNPLVDDAHRNGLSEEGLY